MKAEAPEEWAPSGLVEQNVQSCMFLMLHSQAYVFAMVVFHSKLLYAYTKFVNNIHWLLRTILVLRK